ncbi:hypothetical protein ACRYGS_20860 [Mycobacteroides abscessus]
MNRTIARALRRVANRVDPPKVSLTVNNANCSQVRGQERLARAQRDLLLAEQRLASTRVGKASGETFAKSWATKIIDGIATTSPALPNMAVMRKVPWWRRLLRRFGR